MMVVYVNLPVSARDLAGQMISLYPNPSNGSVRIEGPVHVLQGKISVMDLTGRVVYSEDASTQRSGPYLLDLDYLGKGYYLVRIENSSGDTFLHPLVIQ
jgi:hypothetical protein